MIRNLGYPCTPLGLAARSNQTCRLAGSTPERLREVLRAALRAARADLAYHTRVLDAMGLGAEHKLVIHGGGVYGDRAAAVARCAGGTRSLPVGVRRRLTLENDEHQFSARDVLQMAAAAGFPVVFDALHDAVNPSPEFAGRRADLLRACFATWGTAEGPPDTHFSTQDATKQRGAHGRDVDPGAFATFAAGTGGQAVDSRLEAKGKEEALLRLRHDLALPAGAAA